MFYGLILMCSIGATEYTNDTCTLFNSPNVYNTNDECIVAIQQFLFNPGTQAMLEAGFEIIDVQCLNVVPEKYRGSGI